jgi:formylglycine-generating enzyme required for sulfatase activity
MNLNVQTESNERFTGWKRLGAGAHAVVYKAYDQELSCEVAVKLLNEEARVHGNLVDGLRNEVNISRSLTHPNICRIHDIYEGPKGVGIVMNVLNGCDLSQWMKANKGDTLRTASERLDLIRIVTNTLEFAHKKIVHRDLKPSNIFLVDGDIGQPVIMDFGISVLGEDTDQGVCGTPKYMPPEQYEATDKVDMRSDIFSLGMMAYEFFTDTVPENSLRYILKTKKPPRVALEDMTPPSKYCPVIPPALDRLILQMIAYDMGDRPQSADDVSETLKHIELLSSDIEVGSGARIEAVAVPGGINYIGSPPTSPNSNEKPARRVEVSPYRLGETLVTNAQYSEFIRATGLPPAPLLSDPVFGRADHPVVCLTAEEAEEFCKWAGGRLPREAEWECAALAGTKFGVYPWGNEIPQTGHANIGGVWKTTSSVIAYPAGKNKLGLWDMCGNTWEWCADNFDPDMYKSLMNGALNPISKSNGQKRSLRGGSFQSLVGTGRCAFRGHAQKDERRADIGFRILYEC